MTAPTAEGEPTTDMYRAALEALLHPVFIYNDECVLFANAAAQRALGAGCAADLEGACLNDFLLPEFAEVGIARRSFVVKQGLELKNLPVKVRTLDGRTVQFIVDIRPVRFDGGVAAMATLAAH